MNATVYTSPIIFSASMIRALLDGRKTQTRRLVTSQWANVKMHHEMGERCLLWVRETWALASRATDVSKVYYKAHENASHTNFHRYVSTTAIGRHQPTWPLFKPSIHMPRWASRLTLELSGARIQRLQDISEEDARAEGDPNQGPIASENTHCDWYWELWNSLHGPGSWDTNPEVIAFTFRVHRQNVDALIGQGGAA